MGRISWMGGAFGVLVFACTVLGGCNDRPDASGDLIAAFQSSCRSSDGLWTDFAFSQTRALMGTLQDLQKNDACAPYVTQISQIYNLSNQLTNLYSDSSVHDLKVAEDQVQQLAIAYSQTTDPNLQLTLSTDLATAEATLAQARANRMVAGEKDMRDVYAAATSNLANYTQGMIQQASGLETCLRQSPQVAVELFTNLAAMGGSFVSPVYGAGAAAVGTLVNFALEYLRNAPNEDAIWNLYEIQMPTALSCGLESMTEFYCQASDSYDLLKLQADYYHDPGSQPEPSWRGMDILTRRLPILNKWLLHLKSSVVSDEFDSARQIAAQARVNAVLYEDIVTQGILTKGQAEFDATNDPVRQHDILKTAIIAIETSILQSTSYPPQNTPFTELSNDHLTWICYLVGGLQMTCSPGNPLPSPDRWVDTLLQNNKVTFESLNANWASALKRVSDKVDDEYLSTVEVDPSGKLEDVNESVPGAISPADVLYKIRNFANSMLLSYPGDAFHIHRDPLLKTTIRLIDMIFSIVEDPKLDDMQKIKNIYLQFNLKQGLQFFNTRVSSFIALDLEDRIKHGDLPKDPSEILTLMALEQNDHLSYAGVSDPNALNTDLNHAQRLTSDNFGALRDRFKGSLGKAVDYLSKKAKETGEPDDGPHRPYGMTLGLLCTEILASGMQWPGEVSWDICSKAKINSIYNDPDGSLSLVVGDEAKKLEGKDLLTRACVYHRFLRKGLIAEITKKKQTGALNSSFDLWSFFVKPDGGNK